MSERDDMTEALAAALPGDNIRAYDDRGKPISIQMLAAVIAAELQDQGYRLVRP